MNRTMFAIVAALAACGGSSAQGRGTHAVTVQGTDSDAVTDTGQPGPDAECHDETPTGSSIPRRVCRTKAQSDRDRTGAQDWMRPVVKPTTSN